MKKIEEYTPCELATLATTLGIIIAGKFNADENNVVGNFLQSIGQTVTVIAAQVNNLKKQEEKICGEKESSNKNLQKQMDEIKRHIENLEGTRNC